VAIVPRQVDGAFTEAVFDFLASHDGFVARVYSDSQGIPTLGIGYAMLANTPGWPPRETLESDLEAIGITLTVQDRQLLIAVGAALSGHDLATARALVAPRSGSGAAARRGPFSFTLSRAQAMALFELSRPDVEVLLQRRLGRDLMARLAGSRELVALFSLAYDNPALMSAELVSALAAGARERAWYEIRFGANRAHQAPLQHRRNRESAMFGLTGDATTEVERNAIASLLDDRRLTIKRYFLDLGLGEEDARANTAHLYEKAGLPLPPCLRDAGIQDDQRLAAKSCASLDQCGAGAILD